MCGLVGNTLGMRCTLRHRTHRLPMHTRGAAGPYRRIPSRFTQTHTGQAYSGPGPRRPAQRALPRRMVAGGAPANHLVQRLPRAVHGPERAEGAHVVVAPFTPNVQASEKTCKSDRRICFSDLSGAGHAAE